MNHWRGDQNSSTSMALSFPFPDFFVMREEDSEVLAILLLVPVAEDAPAAGADDVEGMGARHSEERGEGFVLGSMSGGGGVSIHSCTIVASPTCS
jgi:hypothetical protein